MKNPFVKSSRLSNSVQITLIISATILVVAILGFILVSSITGNTYGKNTISVNGQSTVKVIPDEVGVYLNIETVADTAQEARENNTNIFNSLKSALIASGFKDEEIKTQTFSINPNYVWENNKNTQKGYKASHAVVLEFSSEDSEKISGVLDSAVSSGVSIGYINFQLSSELEAQEKANAIEKASKDANLKADATAKGLDKRLGNLVSVSVDNYNYYPLRVYDSATQGASSSSSAIEEAISKESLNPSEQSVYASVNVVYKLR